MKRIGARIFADCLEEQGIATVFAYPGGSVLPIFDALRSRKGIRTVIPTREDQAAFMADGYARVIRRPSVCIATSGPGATNLMTGMAVSFMDSVPVVYVTGDILRDRKGSDAFQEADIWGMSLSVTKHSVVVNSAAEITDALREAFWVAGSGRPGPVLVDIPMDVLEERAETIPIGTEALDIWKREHPFLRGKVHSWRRQLETEIDSGILAESAHRLLQARRPLLLAGGGASSGDAVKHLAEKLSLPVVTTLMGVSVLERSHPLHIGMIGLYGSEAANAALNQCDLLLAVGTRFSDRSMAHAGSMEHTEILHIDIDPAEINKSIHSYLHITGDASQVLEQLTALVPSRATPWLTRQEPEYVGWSPQSILYTAGEAAGSALVVTDVGEHQMQAAEAWPITASGQWLTNAGLGTMGYGLPAACGAALAAGQSVVAVVGDGGLKMSLAELGTLQQEQLPVTILLMDNGCLGMIRSLQQTAYGGRISGAYQYAPNWQGICKAYGLPYTCPENLSRLAEAVNKAVKSRRPAFIHCRFS